MDTDLMSSSSNRLQPQQAKPTRLPCLITPPKGFFDPPFRNGLSFFRQSVYARHSFPIRTVPPNGSIDDTVIGFWFPHNERQVLLFYLPLFELPRKLLKGRHPFSDDHDSGGILVQSMNDSGTGFSADPLQVWTVVKYRINESSRGSCRRRMNHDSWSFVDDDAVIIFIDNFQGNRFSHQARLLWWQCLDGDEIVGFESSTGFCGFAV